MMVDGSMHSSMHPTQLVVRSGLEALVHISALGLGLKTVGLKGTSNLTACKATGLGNEWLG